MVVANESSDTPLYPIADGTWTTGYSGKTTVTITGNHCHIVSTEHKWNDGNARINRTAHLFPENTEIRLEVRNLVYTGSLPTAENFQLNTNYTGGLFEFGVAKAGDTDYTLASVPYTANRPYYFELKDMRHSGTLELDFDFALYVGNERWF